MGQRAIIKEAALAASEDEGLGGINSETKPHISVIAREANQSPK